jgi:hypothetical protein
MESNDDGVDTSQSDVAMHEVHCPELSIAPFLLIQLLQGAVGDQRGAWKRYSSIIYLIQYFIYYLIKGSVEEG